MKRLIKFLWRAMRATLYSSTRTQYTATYRSRIYALIIKRVVELWKPELILDIGSGTSSYLAKLKELAPQVVAIDVNIDALKNNPAEMKIAADANLLPLKETIGNRRTLVVALSIYEHLRHWPAIRNVLHLIQIPNLRHIMEPHTAIPLLYLYPSTIREHLAQKLCCYINWNTEPRTITQTLEKRGLIVKIFPYYYSNKAVSPNLRTLFSLLQRIGIPHGYIIIAIPPNVTRRTKRAIMKT